MIAITKNTDRPTGDDNVCQAVLSEVAATTGTPPEELDQQLYDAINPDALEKVFENRNEENLGRVVFSFAECRVVVRSSGDVSATLL